MNSPLCGHPSFLSLYHDYLSTDSAIRDISSNHYLRLSVMFFLSWNSNARLLLGIQSPSPMPMCYSTFEHVYMDNPRLY